MAEGGYEEGILEFDDIANINLGLEETKSHRDNDKQNIPDLPLCGGGREIDQNNSLADTPNEQIQAAQSEANKVKDESHNCEHNDISDLDIERINAEINIVKEAHKKLLEEKNVLIESLQSGTFMVQVK